MRSIAASGFLNLWDAPDGSWLSRQFAAVGTQWNGNVVCEIEVKWSGAVGNLASQSRARAEPCRYLARREWIRRSRLSPTKRKCRLGEATGKKLKTEIRKGE